MATAGTPTHATFDLKLKQVYNVVINVEKRYHICTRSQLASILSAYKILVTLYVASVSSLRV